MSAASILSPEDGYAALDAGPVAVRGTASVVWIEGPDARSFLHGLLTQDVAAIAPGEARPALLLDAKGRIRSAMRVHRDSSDAFTLVMRPDIAADTVVALDDFHFSEDLDVLGPEPSEILTVAGVDPERAAELAELVLPGEVPGTLDLVVGSAATALVALGVPEAPPDALTARRIEAGVPIVGIDTGDTTLVQEAGLEGTTVSFDKGCYLGQETVARVEHRGGVRRRLCGLSLTVAAVPGTPVALDGREMGVVTSVATSPERGGVGLAILRREAEPGATVDVGGAEASVVSLPFR